MSELELYKFLNENSIEHHWEREEKELIAWIPFCWLQEFAELIGGNCLSDGGLMVNLQNNYIALDLVPVAEYHEIELENILKKEVV